MNCINTKSKEYIELLEASKLPSLLLEMRISQFQDKNGLESYPELKDIVKSNEINFQKNQTVSNEGILASEQTIRDLAAKIADRIGMKVVFESDRTKDYKGKIENNIAYVNLAYATLDTPIHEILGHPIIRALKKGKELTGATFSIKDISNDGNAPGKFELTYYSDETLGDVAYFDTREEAEKYASSLKASNGNPQLYQNLLKELETGRGKEVLDRIKRDYKTKGSKVLVGEKTEYTEVYSSESQEEAEYNGFTVVGMNEDGTMDYRKITPVYEDRTSEYTLEEQQEEAIVELLGLMTAEKLDNVKDGKLISLLKRLLKEMKQFVRSLINQKEVEIDKLPDNMTINDLANVLAYSNSKLILPGYEVEYTTPDNMKFKTYQEANNHISELSKNVKNINLDDIKMNNSIEINNISDIPESVTVLTPTRIYSDITGRLIKKDGIWHLEHLRTGNTELAEDDHVIQAYKKSINYDNNISSFINKNKEYEQSKEIIEEWKKVNNIQYNPEEIYSRGQEFTSIVGAYSDFDVNLMMQNLLSHIEDNEKAGGKFAISAFTKPTDRKIGHLEGGGGKIKFKINPQSKDILWASNIDVFSGSVWDASEKVNKDKKSELLGVSYTKYPSMRSIDSVQPNLASIVDNLAHHHNELGIVLTGNNFRLEYDEDIPYTTKKIIDGINKILDQKYGKLVKPTVNEGDYKRKYIVTEYTAYGDVNTFTFDNEKEALDYKNSKGDEEDVNIIIKKQNGIQPTQTKNNTISISDSKISTLESNGYDTKYFVNATNDDIQSDEFDTKEEAEAKLTEWESKDLYNNALFKIETTKVYKEKKRTEQALINTKIAALKEVAKKQPRSLIRSEVKPINGFNTQSYQQFDEVDELPFQKVPSVKEVDFSDVTSENVDSIFENKASSEPIVQKSDSKNKELLFGSNEVNSLPINDVLTNLISSDVFESTENVGFFLEQAMNLLYKSGATLKLVTSTSNKALYDKFDNNSVMMFDSITNTIYVTDTALENFDAATLASTLIHEVVHSTTVKAYFNPKSFDEKEFKSFIDKSYAQYKYLALKRNSEGNLMYGFTNQAEFIAEIFSNPEFRNELQNIEKTWWNQFVDNVRRLFGMSRSILNNELIRSAILFETVQDFATRNSSNWAGTRVYDPRYNKFATEFFNKVNKPESATLQNQIDLLTNSQLNNISNIISRAQSASKKAGTKNKAFLASIKKLDVEVNRALKTNKFDAINHYTDFMIAQIEHIYKTINTSSTTGELEKLDTIERYKSYLGASDLLTPIMDTLNDTRTKDLPQADLDIINSIQEKLTMVSGMHDQIKSKFRTHTIEAFRKELKSSYYSEITVQNFREEVAKGYPQNSSQSKKEWVNEQVILRKDELDVLVENDINEVIGGLSADIDGFDHLMLSSLNTKSRLIQIVTKVITKMKTTIDKLVRDNDFVLDKLYSDLVKERGKYDITNLYDKSDSGEVFVKGKYSIKFRDKYINEYSKMLDEVNVLKEKHRANGFQEFEINQFADVNDIYRKLAAWRAENTVTVNKIIQPHPKYKNDLKFTKSEQAIYDEYITLARNSEMVFGTNNSLIKTSFSAEYFSLPYATVSKLERLTTGRLNVKDTVKQSISNFTDWKIDDLENTQEMYKHDGTRIFNIPIHYRNNISKAQDPEKHKALIADQSFDLLTLMRLENYNQVNFKVKSKNEVILNAFVDISREKTYLKTKPGTNNFVSNVFGVKTKYVTKKGVESNEYKRLQTIINQTLYNVFTEESFKIAGKDINKLVQSVNKHTSFLGMTVNYFNAPVNVMNAEFQTFLLKVGGDISAGNLKSAHLAYAKDLPNILADTGRPTKHSLVNQLNLLTDIFGGLTHEQNDFIKDTILKGITDPSVLQVLQTGGEHMVQSVLNMALLKSIKVMNDKGQYVKADGTVTDTKSAASLFDMVEQDPDTKQVKFNDKFTYTDKSTVTKFDEGGLENVRLFIKKKVFDSMGEYDKNFQTEIQKYWIGQLVMMYKKYIFPLGLTRYRGFAKAFAKRENLSADDRHWNESLQQYEEGFYVTTFRFITRGLVQNLVKMKFDMISKDWNTLTEYERANIRKGLIEASVLIMLQTIIVPLMVGMAGGADDDDSIVYLAMLSRRLEQELSFYSDPNDAYKVTRSPIASMNLIEDLLNVAKFTMSPGLWFSETKDGTPRAYKVFEKVILPGTVRPDKNAKTILQGMNRGLLAPYEEGIFYKMMND